MPSCTSSIHMCACTIGDGLPHYFWHAPTINQQLDSDLTTLAISILQCSSYYHQSCSQWDDDDTDGPLQLSACSSACADGHRHHHTSGPSIHPLFSNLDSISLLCSHVSSSNGTGSLLSTNIWCLRVRVSPLQTPRANSSRQYMLLQTLLSPTVHPELPAFQAYHASCLSPPSYAQPFPALVDQYLVINLVVSSRKRPFVICHPTCGLPDVVCFVCEYASTSINSESQKIQIPSHVA